MVANLRGKTFIGTNELRLYDVDRGYTFNMVELSVKKDPSDRYPFGFGLVLTGGEDVQFNHAIGVFRDADEAPTDTDKFDVQEAYLAYKVPVGWASRSRVASSSPSSATRSSSRPTT